MLSGGGGDMRDGGSPRGGAERKAERELLEEPSQSPNASSIHARPSELGWEYYSFLLIIAPPTRPCPSYYITNFVVAAPL